MGRGVGYIWRGGGGVVGVVRVGEWRLGAGSRHAGTGLLDVGFLSGLEIRDWLLRFTEKENAT